MKYAFYSFLLAGPLYDIYSYHIAPLYIYVYGRNRTALSIYLTQFKGNLHYHVKPYVYTIHVHGKMQAPPPFVS